MSVFELGDVDSSFDLTSDGDNFKASKISAGAKINGLEGNDTFVSADLGTTYNGGSIFGGAGNDRLIVREIDKITGPSLFNGGEGTDTLELYSGSQIKISASSAGLRVSYTNGGVLDLVDVERIVIRGSDVNDTLTGGAGNDWLDGGGGNDTFIGSAGDDNYVFNSTGDRVVGSSGGGGIDTIWSTVSVDLRKQSATENLRLQSGDINGTGNALDNLITGSAGANRIAGGAGNDSLYGKGGADVFYFAEKGAAHQDSIWDYGPDDKIELSKTVFAGLDANNDGILDADAFIVGSRPEGAGPQIRYNAKAGNISYDADGSGGQPSEVIAYIGTNKAYVDHTDILIV